MADKTKKTDSLPARLHNDIPPAKAGSITVSTRGPLSTRWSRRVPAFFIVPY